jgi:hypothetical protein
VSSKARRVLAHLAGHYVRALVRHPPFRYAEDGHEAARACVAAARGAAGDSGHSRGPRRRLPYRTARRRMGRPSRLRLLRSDHEGEGQGEGHDSAHEAR